MRSASNRGQILAGLHGMTKKFILVHNRKRLHDLACVSGNSLWTWKYLCMHVTFDL